MTADAATTRRAVSCSVRPMILPTAASSSRWESPAGGRAKPSPMSDDPARTLSRSRTCLRNRATTKLRAATGTVHRKTVWSVSAYASTIGSATSAGSRCRPSGLSAARAIVAGSAAPVRAPSATAADSFGASVLS